MKIRNEFEFVFKSIIPLFNMRGFTIFLKNQKHKQNLIGVEIGVNKGYNAFNLLHNLSIKTLYLVDPYLLNELYGDNENRKKVAYKRLKNYRAKIEFIYKTSLKAKDIIPNNLDFVYIDGNHNYDFVKQDIELYYSKLKKGGILGGHDFSACCLGVCCAVMEFIEKNKLKLYNGKSSDWWIIK